MKKRFIETIKVLDGSFMNVQAHIRRMQDTVSYFYARPISFTPYDFIVPLEFRRGVVKCRITYDTDVLNVEYEHYAIKTVSRLDLVVCNNIVYDHKFEDRQPLLQLWEEAGSRNEILIVKNGYITDTTYSNIVLKNGSRLITPDTFLLNGTRRQQLLSEGIIEQRRVRPADLIDYEGLYLINAMIGIEDDVFVASKDIVLKALP